MPHVVFDKEIDLESFSKEFREMMIKKPFFIKLLNVYTDREKRTVLVPAVVIDKLHQQFLIEISTRKDKTTIRLFPGTDPEKTDGIKMSLGLTAKIIQEMNPNHKITKTNIDAFLFKPEANKINV
ncbi:MAG: hypothetical protein OES15_03325 [Nitrosopumilus sp.]|jgi:hypothetical protein|nr:hypothetical protein [Nitrosopumilus sp.]MDH3852886.1 hypothetical protein [Nitrosopumilus sp.]